MARKLRKLPWPWHKPALTTETGFPSSPQPEEGKYLRTPSSALTIHLLLFSQLGDHCQAAFYVRNLQDIVTTTRGAKLPPGI